MASLASLPPDGWLALQEAHSAASDTNDAAEDALANVLAKHKLRDGWFALRREASALAKKAAADYAAETGEGQRTIEHVASYDGWDGQREKSKLEVLGPAHERAFLDAAAAAVGVIIVKPYVSQPDFERFWSPYASILLNGVQ